MKITIMMNLKTTIISSFLTLGIVQNASAGSTMVTDAVGTQQLWTFQEILGAQKLTSKINQVDGKGITQTWDANGNMLTRTDEEGRVTSYTYNATNQKTSMTEAYGTSQARTTTYTYVNADIDLVTTATSPSVFSNYTKVVTNAYDANLNITSVTVDGYDLQGNFVSRATSFDHDVYGKVTEIDGPRTDVSDITTLVYYDCSTGAECGQLQSVTNALGHTTTYDLYDGAARLLQSTDANGTVTAYTYHPRGWVLSMTQTPIIGAVRTTTYDYDNVGQVIKVTQPDGSEQNYVYDAAHYLRQIYDNLDNKVMYEYDAKGNRIRQRVLDPSRTLVRRTVTSYNYRNFVEKINNSGSVTTMITDAVGNLSRQTDPNGNRTNHSFDVLDRLTTTIDALTNNTGYAYNEADQLVEVVAPNGATTHYEYDDLGNQTKEISPDRGTLVYTHDDAGNVLTTSDDRGVTRNYQYDVLNRLISVTYPSSTENITYSYDLPNCGFGVGRLCEVSDESGQTNYEYDAWGNIETHLKTELGITYTTRYQYDEMNRTIQMTYPNDRIVDYQRDAIGRIDTVNTTVPAGTTNVLSNRTYRGDGLPTGQTLGNGLHETRSYDQQGRTTNISLGAIESWDYQYDANGNILEIDKTIEGRTYDYDVLDRVIADTRLTISNLTDYTYQYDENGNRTKLTNRNFRYSSDTNRMTQDGGVVISRDAIGNALNHIGNRSFTYNEAGRLHTASTAGVLKATYTYNANNQRTRKDIPNLNSQVFHYDLQGNLIMKSIQTGRPLDDYIWVDGELRQFTTLQGTNNGGINTERVKTFLTPDHLMTPRLGTNDTQTVSWRWDSDAFQITRPVIDPDGDGTNVNLLIGFPGQYYDSESLLYYNWNRYYDPRSGRYVSSDPIGLDGGLNTFGYVGGNPLGYYDPNGLFICLNQDQIDLIASSVGGATAGALQGALTGGPAGALAGGAIGGATALGTTAAIQAIAGSDSTASAGIAATAGALTGSGTGGRASGFIGGAATGIFTGSANNPQIAGAVGGGIGGFVGGVAGEFSGNNSGAGRFSFGKPQFNPLAAGAKGGLFGLVGGFVEGLVAEGLNGLNDCDENCSQ